MNQTPVNFDAVCYTTLTKRGLRTVNSRKPANKGENSASGLFTATASGDKLPMMLIFRGKSDGPISKRVFPRLNRLNHPLPEAERYCPPSTRNQFSTKNKSYLEIVTLLGRVAYYTKIE